MSDRAADTYDEVDLPSFRSIAQGAVGEPAAQRGVGAAVPEREHAGLRQRSTGAAPELGDGSGRSSSTPQPRRTLGRRP